MSRTTNWFGRCSLVLIFFFATAAPALSLPLRLVNPASSLLLTLFPPTSLPRFGLIAHGLIAHAPIPLPLPKSTPNHFRLFDARRGSMAIKMSDPRGESTPSGEMAADRHFVLNVTTGLTSLACTIMESRDYAKTR